MNDLRDQRKVWNKQFYDKLFDLRGFDCESVPQEVFTDVFNMVTKHLEYVRYCEKYLSDPITTALEITYHWRQGRPAEDLFDPTLIRRTP